MCLSNSFLGYFGGDFKLDVLYDFASKFLPHPFYKLSHFYQIFNYFFAFWWWLNCLEISFIICSCLKFNLNIFFVNEIYKIFEFKRESSFLLTFYKRLSHLFKIHTLKTVLNRFFFYIFGWLNIWYFWGRLKWKSGFLIK